MRKLITRVGFLLVFGCMALVAPAFANHTQPDGSGNLTINGWHATLNIHGVTNPKNADMDNGNGNSIFVRLGSKPPSNPVETNIYLIQTLLANDDKNGNGVLDKNELFQVCDQNGFDEARDCQGNPLGGGKQGASFRLPCNTHISSTDGEQLLGCDESAANNAAYEVFARALGQPGGQARATTCATETDDQDGDGISGEVVCSTENVLLVRTASKPQWKNVTQALTSLCLDTLADGNLDGSCDTRYALFHDDLIDWFWKWANQGLRLAQLRFYLVD